MALDALEDMANYLNSGEGDFVIVDATNNNPQRRQKIRDYFNDNMIRDYQILWIESVCNNRDIIEKNILKVKVSSDDYKGWNDPEKAANDFRNRIAAYEKTYVNLGPESDGDDTAYIQIIDNGQEIKVRNLKGELISKILEYLVNLHTLERPIYFLQAGDSENDLKGIIGGDMDLCREGIIFAEFANNFFKAKTSEIDNFPDECKVYSSTKKQSIQTARRITCVKTHIETKLLDELNYGFQDNLTEEEFFNKYPEEKAEKQRDPLNYRYPRGESYIDLIERVQRVINDIERTEGPVIIVVKKSVLRCLYGYFAFEAEIKNIENIPSIDLPSDTIIEFTPAAYGFKKELFKIEMTSGFRKHSEMFTQDLSVFYDPNLKYKKKPSPNRSTSILRKKKNSSLDEDNSSPNDHLLGPSKSDPVIDNVAKMSSGKEKEPEQSEPSIEEYSRLK